MGTECRYGDARSEADTALASAHQESLVMKRRALREAECERDGNARAGRLV